MATIVQILIGLVLLTYGLRLFWLFVGVVGFFAGFTLGGLVLQDRAPEITLALAVILGIIGVVLAFSVQRIALIVTGFVTGGYLAYSLLTAIGYENIWLWLGTFLLFGALGAALVALLFNTALILMTSVTGAILIVRVLPIQEMLLLVVFLALMLAGIAWQISQRRRT